MGCAGVQVGKGDTVGEYVRSVFYSQVQIVDAKGNARICSFIYGPFDGESIVGSGYDPGSTGDDRHLGVGLCGSDKAATAAGGLDDLGDHAWLGHQADGIAEDGSVPSCIFDDDIVGIKDVGEEPGDVDVVCLD